MSVRSTYARLHENHGLRYCKTSLRTLVSAVQQQLSLRQHYITVAHGAAAIHAQTSCEPCTAVRIVRPRTLSHHFINQVQFATARCVLQLFPYDSIWRTRGAVSLLIGPVAKHRGRRQRRASVFFQHTDLVELRYARYQAAVHCLVLWKTVLEKCPSICMSRIRSSADGISEAAEELIYTYRQGCAKYQVRHIDVMNSTHTTKCTRYHAVRRCCGRRRPSLGVSLLLCRPI